MENKNAVIKRLAVFYVLAVIPMIIFALIIYSNVGADAFAAKGENAFEAMRYVSFFGIMGMLLPSTAHILTRLITKESFKNTYLGWTAEKGKLKYYLFSILIKPIEAFVTLIIVSFVFLGGNIGELFAGDMQMSRAATILMTFVSSIIILFPALGEEWGWRGYMMPKLLELMPKPAAIVVGGVLWGLWHAPLTCLGHNFGVDYAGFPFVGIVLMCVYCILMNALLTFLTERTKSVYPAALCHALNNNLSSGVLAAYLLSTDSYADLSQVGNFNLILITMAVSVPVSVICFVLFVRKEKMAEK